MPESAMNDLTKRTLVGLAEFQLFLAIVIFLPAWSLRYWQGWLYWLIFGLACLVLGLYAEVRHPMYTAAILLYVATPLALGSWWGLAPAAVLVAVIVWRLMDEEAYLARHLSGYPEYQRQVRARLVPGVW